VVAGLTFDVDTLNVYATGFLGDVQACVVEGLIAPDEHARYVPVLATVVPTLENGGVVLSDGGRAMTVRYSLRAGVRWHDGRPFTAQDVAFTWRAVSNPAFIAESKDGSEDILSIETPDDLTVICRYRRVVPNFAATLFTFGILPRHVLEGADLNTAPYNDRPIGTGPFKVTDFKRGQYVLTERNPLYWRRDPQGRALPYLDRLIFKIIPNANTLMTQLRSGELDLVVQTPYEQAKQMKGIKGVRLVRAPLLSWQHLDFNFRNATLKDLAVRRAVAHALNRAALVKVQGGYPTPIKSVVLPLFDFYDPAAPEHPFDPAFANAILDRAGYVRGPNGVRVKDGRPLTYRFMVQAGKGDDELAQQIIIAQLKTVGLDAVPDNKTGVAYRQARYKGDYDLAYSAWVTGADPIYSKFFSSHGANNNQHYANPTLDAVLARMEATLDPAERRRNAAAMQRILAEDLPTIPLTSNMAVIAMRDGLSNFRSNPTNMTPFVDASRWRWTS
jgi:peptide/nickel transport system substrate-binding protein